MGTASARCPQGLANLSPSRENCFGVNDGVSMLQDQDHSRDCGPVPSGSPRGDRWGPSCKPATSASAWTARPPPPQAPGGRPAPPHTQTRQGLGPAGGPPAKESSFPQTRQELEGCADQPVRGSEDLRLRRARSWVRRPRGRRGVLPGRPSGPLQRKRLTAAGRGGEGQEAQRPLIGDRGPGAACAQTMCSGGSREGPGDCEGIS